MNEQLFLQFGYAGLFAISFLAATLVPLGSEAAVAVMAASGFDPSMVFIIATTGNSLGSLVNYFAGKWGGNFIVKKYVRTQSRKLDWAGKTFGKWGSPALFFAWLPIVGDPLTVVAGVLRVNLLPFIFLGGPWKGRPLLSDSCRSGLWDWISPWIGFLKLYLAFRFFSGLDEDQLRLVRNMATEVSFKKGQFIFYDGDKAEGFYAALDGQVKIYKISPEGKEQIFHVFGPGEPFGEVPVFSGDSYPANAQALVKTKCLYFSRKGIVNLINQSPSIAMNMLAVLSRRLREFTVQVENLSLKEVDGRVAGYLLHMAVEQGHENYVILHISKAHLASLLGTIPETLSRSLARLKEKDLIQVDKREIQILDRRGLEDCSNGGNGDMDD